MAEFFNKEGYPNPTEYEALKRIEKEEQNRPLVYICSPYSGDVQKNTEKARKYCRYAAEKGVIPLAPHLLLFLDDNDPDERELGMLFGKALMSKCKEVWVFGDKITDGMREEIKTAGKRHMKIRYFKGVIV